MFSKITGSIINGLSCRFQVEYDALQNTVQEKEEKLSILSKKVERSDQAKNDLRGLEETGTIFKFAHEMIICWVFG